MKLAPVTALLGSLFFATLYSIHANPIYPVYGDFAPIILPGGYAAGPAYPIIAGGGYFGPPISHHSGGSRYSGQETGSYSEKTIEYQKDSKYYYGGQYKGSCLEDGLYYKDDTTFVMCSNGYPHEQPCPPGTKTSGSPSYKPGYYYGYTDLCSVNLVDYGLGPEHYAPVGPIEEEKPHYSRGGSTSSKRVAYSSSSSAGGYGAPHGEKHVSKDVSVSHQGPHGHQQQHAHVEKHKVQEGYGSGYDKTVVKQGSISSYNDVVPHESAHYGVPGGYAPHHKEKHETVSYHSPSHHSQHTLSHHASGEVGLGGSVQQISETRKEHHFGEGYPAAPLGGHGGSYDAVGFQPADRAVSQSKVVRQEYHGNHAGHHQGSVEKYSQESATVGAYSGGYPHLGAGSNKPLPYEY